MSLLRRVTLTVTTALAFLYVTAGNALAQVKGDTSAIPEAAPKNWSIQFIAIPVLGLVLTVAVISIAVYATIMIRARYPVKER